MKLFVETPADFRDIATDAVVIPRVGEQVLCSPMPTYTDRSHTQPVAMTVSNVKYDYTADAVYVTVDKA